MLSASAGSTFFFVVVLMEVVKWNKSAERNGEGRRKPGEAKDETLYVCVCALSLSLLSLSLRTTAAMRTECRGVNGAGGFFVTTILAILQHKNIGYFCNSNIGYCACKGREKRTEKFLIMKKERKTAEKERER
jgi:hypothetical protein